MIFRTQIRNNEGKWLHYRNCNYSEPYKNKKGEMVKDWDMQETKYCPNCGKKNIEYHRNYLGW